jgi:hypothetical protein
MQTNKLRRLERFLAPGIQTGLLLLLAGKNLHEIGRH